MGRRRSAALLLLCLTLLCSCGGRSHGEKAAFLRLRAL